MKCVFPTLLLVFSFLSGFSQDKKPITHEDLWLLKRVGAPAISPDGKHVIFSVTEPSYDEKEQINDVWVVPTDGSAKARKLTAGKAGESAYCWSPDGKYIAFVAKRDGDEVAQIYLMNFKEGGEGQRLTSLTTGASSPKWSPDGKMILFQSNVFPTCYTDSCNKKAAEEKKKQKYNARVYTSFPIRDFDKWIDEKKTHLFVQSIEPKSTAKDIFTDVVISKQEGFQYYNACWSADSKEIIFAATTEANTAAYQDPPSALYKVAVSGGAEKQLTTEKQDFGNPRVTKDGKYLFCYLTVIDNNKMYNLTKLVRYDWPSMQNKMVMAEKLDRPINSIILQGEQIYLCAEDQGMDKIYTLPVKGGDAKLLSTIKTGCYGNISVSTDGETKLVAGYESASMPSEIVLINKDGSHKALTNFNSEKIAKLDLPDIETIWYTKSDGKKIRSMVVRPAGFDASKKYPLFVVMHGGPSSSWKENWGYRWNMHLLAKPGYVLIMTDYTGSTGYGEKFSQEIQLDPFKGPGEEINAAAADAIKRFTFIDASKQAAGGGSYGGHLANWMQATTTHYKALICHAGLVNSISQWGTSDGIFGRELMNGGLPWSEAKTWKEQNPYMYADKFKTPMLITIGELDYRVPINNSIENWHILQRMKIPSKLIVFPEENHWISKAENSKFFYKEVHAWLEKYLN